MNAHHTSLIEQLIESNLQVAQAMSEQAKANILLATAIADLVESHVNNDPPSSEVL